MTTPELYNYINVRNGELCSDEILECIDIVKNPQLDHITYQDNYYTMWDGQGNKFTFKVRNW